MIAVGIDSYITRTAAERFVSDTARTASIFNGLKNDPSYEFTYEKIRKLMYFMAMLSFVLSS